MNKKGQTDIFFVVILLLALILTLFVGLRVLNEMTPALQAEFPDNPTMDNALTRGNTFFTAFDIGFWFLFVAGIVSSLITAFFVRTHPVLSFVSFILLLIFTYISAVLSNFYDELAAVPELAVEVAQFPNVTFFFNNLPKIMVLTIILTIIVTWAKLRTGRVEL